MNKVILVGRLAQDPEVRYTQGGKAVASFNLAVNRFGGGSAQKESADFIPIVAWEKLAEICGNNLTKGSQILVEGRLQIRSYETQDGQKRRVSEVVAQSIEFLGSKRAAAEGGSSSSVDMNSFGSEVFPEEEIPF
ncbi:MAG: single-stranded DNA-binding protein [Negativicutes bacterium]|jgi:single-strand DNA-binding protein|nr:single-stranded DNA-binding protein [Negativicutes bacterium]MBP8629812.1 single-stranded DNA-binding protein [Negativicutes bacterium]MBP9537664.1 single-stranded DNA-binding protein [Negativicutes bacterium]MBP9949902.1 single-stranded DNA-binding protein [Negativicutes bacterium]